MTKTSGHGAAFSQFYGDGTCTARRFARSSTGRGPLFRHDSPEGSNPWSPLFLVNLWIPCQQITRPPALMGSADAGPVPPPARYTLPTSSLPRARIRSAHLNDIWTYLPDDSQRWYFTSEMDLRSAYVFNTPVGAPRRLRRPWRGCR